MESDIKLKNNGLTEVEGRRLKVSGHDLELDHKVRRSSRNRTKPRRAMVHDFEDGLTLNWANDYPGGVTINNGKIVNTTLEGKTEAKGSLTVEGELKTKETIKAAKGIVVERGTGIHVKGTATFDSKCTAKDIRLSGLGYDERRGRRVNSGPLSNPNINIPGQTTVVIREPKSLVKVIKDMQKKIDKLEQRVRELERR